MIDVQFFVDIMDAYEWLICYLLKETTNKLDGSNKSEFWKKNDSQVYYAKTLSMAFIQHFFLHRMLVVIDSAADVAIKNVLLKLFALYGVWSLEKYLATLYQGGYASGSKLTTLVHDAILKLCNDLKDDAVSLIDAIAPPDFAVDSVLGYSDGMVLPSISVLFQFKFSQNLVILFFQGLQAFRVRYFTLTIRIK